MEGIYSICSGLIFFFYLHVFVYLSTLITLFVGLFQT